MSLFTRNGTLFKTRVDANVLGHQSPKGNFKIVPDYVMYANRWMHLRYGMTWAQFKDRFFAVILSPAHDGNIFANITRILILISQVVPVRTGKLLDFILSTMRIIRKKLTQGQFYAEFQYQWPLDRPLTIPTPAHVPPATGYGEWGTVKLRHTIPNVKVLRVTAGGNALYLLNDPFAISDPKPEIDRVGFNTIMDDFEATFVNLKISCRMGVGGPGTLPVLPDPIFERKDGYFSYEPYNLNP